MVKLGRQTESSYSKVYVCVCSSTHRLSQKKRERKMYWGRGEGETAFLLLQRYTGSSFKN